MALFSPVVMAEFGIVALLALNLYMYLKYMDAKAKGKANVNASDNSKN